MPPRKMPRRAPRKITPRYLVSWAERLTHLMRRRGIEHLNLQHSEGHRIELKLGDLPFEPTGNENDDQQVNLPTEPDDGALRTSWGS